jgi:hypothetical protein
MVLFGQIVNDLLIFTAIKLLQMEDYLIGKNFPSGTSEDGKICRIGIIHGSFLSHTGHSFQVQAAFLAYPEKYKGLYTLMLDIPQKYPYISY